MTLEELTRHIKDAYDVEPDHPFKMDEVSRAFRHIDNRKWFALTMNVPYRTLGIARDGQVDIVNLKGDPFLIGSLRQRAGFLPAYHMNKDKWLTALLDGSAEDEEILALVAVSYDLTAGGKRKK